MAVLAAARHQFLGRDGGSCSQCGLSANARIHRVVKNRQTDPQLVTRAIERVRRARKTPAVLTREEQLNKTAADLGLMHRFAARLLRSATRPPDDDFRHLVRMSAANSPAIAMILQSLLGAAKPFIALEKLIERMEGMGARMRARRELAQMRKRNQRAEHQGT